MPHDSVLTVLKVVIVVALPALAAAIRILKQHEQGVLLGELHCGSDYLRGWPSSGLTMKGGIGMVTVASGGGPVAAATVDRWV